MLKNGELIAVGVGPAKETYLTTAASIQILEKQNDLKQKQTKPAKNIHFLSPFDNAIIQRKRLNKLFGFDFNIECYLPEPKRKFGYWCLPILYNNKFVARFDPKADRSTKTFNIKSIHFEKKFLKSEDFNEIFVKKLKAFAEFNSCTKITLHRADKAWKKEILSKL